VTRNNDIAVYLKTACVYPIYNEEALSLKCQALYLQGKKSLAKNTYNSFCKEYETLLGEKYKKPLSKIIDL
jgi:hypothetical protein